MFNSRTNVATLFMRLGQLLVRLALQALVSVLNAEFEEVLSVLDGLFEVALDFINCTNLLVAFCLLFSVVGSS